jgi:hypothetical protein
MNWYDGLQQVPRDVQRVERPFRWLSGGSKALLRRSIKRCNYGYLCGNIHLVDMTANEAMRLFGTRKKKRKK